MNAIPFSQLFTTRQSAAVPAGTTVRVFYGKVPDSCYGFIKRLATSVWYPSVSYIIRVDGELWDTLDREVPITEPLKYDGEEQILVKDHVEVYAKNDSVNDYTLGFFIDGRAYHRESALAEVKNGSNQ